MKNETMTEQMCCGFCDDFEPIVERAPWEENEPVAISKGFCCAKRPRVETDAGDWCVFFHNSNATGSLSGN